MLLKGDITRDDSQRRFLAQHSVATLLQRCVTLKIVVANRPVQHHCYVSYVQSANLSGSLLAAREVTQER